VLSRAYACSHVLVNQFPYEACLIRKDLLPTTLRRLQSATAGDSAPPHPQPRFAC
jgi:hypothetical protein